MGMGQINVANHWRQEQASEEKSSKEWIHKMVTDLGGNLTATFQHGLQRYEDAWLMAEDRPYWCHKGVPKAWRPNKKHQKTTVVVNAG